MAVVVKCPGCASETAIVGAGIRCGCGFQQDAEAAAEAYARDVLGQSWESSKGDYDPVHKCPGCDADALVERGPSGGQCTSSDQYICFECGDVWAEGDLDVCDKCAELFVPDEMSVCSDCFERAIAS